VENLPVQTQGSTALVEIEQSRAVQEVQASMFIAKRFPRDPDTSLLKILKACERPALAADATYSYPKGGTKVEGPSIRLAEVLAQNWGNLDFGIREIARNVDDSEVEAFCWDKETNVRQTKTFSVPHIRYSKKKGNFKLSDPRDIYEMVANLGARRMRACILGIIPGDIVDAAISKCTDTLTAGDGKSLEDRIRDMLITFDKLGISKEMVEVRIGHKTTAITVKQLVDLGKIYNSIKDGMSKREDWFDMPSAHTSKESKDLTGKIKAGKKAPTKPAPRPEPEKEPETKSEDHKAANLLALGEDSPNMMKAMQSLGMNNVPSGVNDNKRLNDKYIEIIKEGDELS